MGKLTWEEGIADAPAAMALFASIKAAIATVPPTNPKIADYARALGVADGTAGAQLAALVDTLIAQSKT